MTDSAPARAAYAEGADPIEWAVFLAQAAMEAASLVAEVRETRPDGLPWYGAIPTDESVARRIVGALLDAGWTPPARPDSCPRCGNDPLPDHCCPDCGRIG